MTQLPPGPVYIYGAGHFGRALASAVERDNWTVYAFIDSFLPEDVHADIPILRLGSPLVDTQVPVINSVMGHPEVEEALRASGFRTLVSTPAAFQMFPSALEIFVSDGFLWRTPDAGNRVNLPAIDQLAMLVKDSKSRDLLGRLAAFRLRPSWDTYPYPEEWPWYLPQDVPFYEGLATLRVIDCGAFDGDTLRKLASRFGQRLIAYLGIEANIENAARLRDQALTLGLASTGDPNAYRVAEAACADFDGIGYFAGSGTVGALVTQPNDYANSSQQVRCLQLDSVRGDTQWNVVIMDIEGAELSAIDGAVNLISDVRPHLAISVYHRPEHLWEIPLRVLEVTDGSYDLYLRQESHWGLETVLYAIPQT